MAEADILKNNKNRDISATVWPIFTKFGTMMLNGSLNYSYRENFLNFNNPRSRTAAILKTVKSQYLCNHLTDFDDIWHNDTYWSQSLT